MKKFRYRLESLLKVKAHLEKEAQKEHAVAREKVLDQQERLGDIRKQRESTVGAQRSRLTGNLSVAGLLVCSRYLVKLKKDLLSGSEVLRGLEIETDKKRQELIDAARQREIYEKLKEKQRKDYYEEFNRVERKETDEIALNTHRLNNRTALLG